MKIDIVEINRIINKEIEFAKEVNPVMALGMSHIQRLINEYDVNEEENISEFVDYLIENASCAFEYQDRELLEKVLRDFVI